MNAPWKPSLGTRDAFAAYICDDTTLDVVRPLAIEFGWQSERCGSGGLRTAIQSLSITASPHILLVDLSESGDPLNDINALAEVCEPGTQVVAIGQINDVRLYRDLMASGIRDYLLKPLSPGQLRDALGQAQMLLAAPRQSDLQPKGTHVTTAVIGTRGGVGGSTIATSLAWLFSTSHKQSTALLDLDIHFGTGALALDLEPGRGLTDAIETPSRIDGLFIERATIRANENLAILSAEAPLNRPLLTDGAAFMRLAEEFRQAFALTVVDLPRSMMINFPQLLGEANVVVLVTELTLASARDAIRVLGWLRAHAPDAQVLVVANKVQSTITEISRADFETSIETRLTACIPFDAKSAANAAKLGQTFVEVSRSSKAGTAIGEIAQQVLGTSSGEPVVGASPAKASLLGKLDLKAMLAKRDRQNDAR